MIFHDSSATLISRSRPARSDMRSSRALIHAVAHAIRIPSAGESRTACRSSTTRRPSSASPGLVGPSNMPRSGPSHRSCSASAARRTSAARLSRARVETIRHLGGRREQDAGHLRERRLRAASPRGSFAAPPGAQPPRPGRPDPPMAVLVTARSSSTCARSSGREASGFSRTPAPGTSEIGATPSASQSGPYSCLTSSTNARRPNSSMRQRSVLTSELLPWPRVTEHESHWDRRSGRARTRPTGRSRTRPRSRRARCMRHRPPVPAAVVNG